MRNTYIAGNWKMNKTASEAVSFVSELKQQMKETSVKVMVAPPFTALDAVSKELQGTNILLGTQNMSSEESGAHTGEVAPDMLKDLGVSVVILGHSERRLIYGESDSFINEKVKLALKKDLDIILCIGETLEQREAGEVESVVKGQIDGGLSGISKTDLSRITLAYEPVWAIGTGKTATPDDANAVHSFIRKYIAEIYDAEAAEEIIIQYGGSVKPNNVKDLMSQKDIDGALVGGASLKTDTFIPIIHFNK